MSPRRALYAFRIDPEHLKALKAIHERDGILPSEQIRRALTAWIERKGVKGKGRPLPNREAAIRKRSKVPAVRRQSRSRS